MDERKSKQRGSESGKEAAQAVEWTAQRRRKRKWKTRVSREEAAAEIEAGGRRKEIADETATKLGGWKLERAETTA